MSIELDKKSWKILEALQRDARLSLTQLAKQVALSVPAVSERLKRLEEAGVLRAYQAVVPADKVGYGVTAFIGITAQQPRKADLLALLDRLPEVLECYHVSGAHSYLIKVITPSIAVLEDFIGRINSYGETHTSLVMSVPIERRAIRSPDRT